MMTSAQPTTMPSPQSDALLSLSRQEAHLQSTLQSLLDAQSEGLLAGLARDGASRDDVASSTTSGSRTPTTMIAEPTAHLQSQSVMPVRQSVKKKVGLRGARRGIARAITNLANLKGEEGRVLEDEVAQREEILSTVASFERKSSGLKEQIRGIEGEETSRRVESLKREEKALGDDIHQLETKLFEMKARHRHLLREIDGLSNSVQSKLSSYDSALVLAEKDIKRFLARPPIETSTAASGVWSLPKERRTLEMAKEQFSEEQQTLKSQLEGVQAEAIALEEGGMVWEQVVQEIDTVEKALREEMQRMQAPLLEGGQEETAETGMKKVLQTMQKARGRVESKLDHAETNGWKLLVCCIGAELEALIEGQAVLEGALEAARGDGRPRTQRNGKLPSHSSGAVDAPLSLVDDGSPPASSSQDATSPAQRFLDRSEDEDDGPSPELLISHHDE